jgi:hypothetical protein
LFELITVTITKKTQVPTASDTNPSDQACYLEAIDSVFTRMRASEGQTSSASNAYVIFRSGDLGVKITRKKKPKMRLVERVIARLQRTRNKNAISQLNPGLTLVRKKNPDVHFTR